jgi:TolB-like protein
LHKGEAMKRVFNVSILIVFVMLASHFCSAQEKLRIAVMDFSTTGGLSKQETVTLGTRLSSMLVKTNAFIVLERGKMEEILQEQGFQQSGCTTTECAVEVGKMVNVQKMVSGSFGKVGRTYTIDLSVIDVQTAQIEKSFFQDYKGEIDGLLDIMQDIANQIAGMVSTKPVPPKPVVVEKKTFDISIESDPKDAQLFINDKKAGTTPFKSKAKEGLELEIRIKKANYKDYVQKITISDNVNIKASLELTEEYKQELAKKATEQKTETAAEQKGSSKKWWYIGGGAVLLGGTAAILLAGSSSKEKPAQTQFPPPPGRPQ